MPKLLAGASSSNLGIAITSQLLFRAYR